MSDYDSIALFYDAIHGDRQRTIKLIYQLIKQNHPQAKTLLSVGCGTGSICQFLAKHYQLTGVDISEEMLVQARKKVRKGKFYCQDMRYLFLPEQFDIIVCLFGVVNHLLNLNDWEHFFYRVKKQLKPGGVFVFDILTELAYYNLIFNSPLVIEQKKMTTVCDISSDDDGGTLWKTRGIDKRGKKDTLLFESEIRQTAFDIDRIKQILTPIFSEVLVFDPEQDEVTESSELIYFLCC